MAFRNVINLAMLMAVVMVYLSHGVQGNQPCNFTCAMNKKLKCANAPTPYDITLRMNENSLFYNLTLHCVSGRLRTDEIDCPEQISTLADRFDIGLQCISANGGDSSGGMFIALDNNDCSVGLPMKFVATNNNGAVTCFAPPFLVGPAPAPGNTTNTPPGLTTSNANSGDNSDGMSTVTLALIIFAAILVLTMIITVAVWRSRRKGSPTGQPPAMFSFETEHNSKAFVPNAGYPNSGTAPEYASLGTSDPNRQSIYNALHEDKAGPATPATYAHLGGKRPIPNSPGMYAALDRSDVALTKNPDYEVPEDEVPDGYEQPQDAIGIGGFYAVPTGKSNVVQYEYQVPEGSNASADHDYETPQINDNDNSAYEVPVSA